MSQKIDSAVTAVIGHPPVHVSGSTVKIRGSIVPADLVKLQNLGYEVSNYSDGEHTVLDLKPRKEGCRPSAGRESHDGPRRQRFR